jgi:16S rRNA (cytidine1402-2'-O)-methyltransferase
MSGTLFVVATPIGNLEDISARALRTLREVAVIAAEDTRRTSRLLARYAITTPTTSLHEHNEQQKTPALLERLASGEHIALVSDAGTPVISDPGQRLVRAAAQKGLRVEPIPGPSAVMAALAVSGFPADSFTFLGFPPTKGKARAEWFNRLKNAQQTVVFFEAPHRIRRTLGELTDISADLEVSICRELTKAHEELVKGPISTVVQTLREPAGEYTVVVDIGQLPDIGGSGERPVRPTEAALLNEFGLMTHNGAVSRRAAIAALASQYGMSVNEVYAMIETARN